MLGGELGWTSEFGLDTLEDGVVMGAVHELETDRLSLAEECSWLAREVEEGTNFESLN